MKKKIKESDVPAVDFYRPPDDIYWLRRDPWPEFTDAIEPLAGVLAASSPTLTTAHARQVLAEVALLSLTTALHRRRDNQPPRLIDAGFHQLAAWDFDSGCFPLNHAARIEDDPSGIEGAFLRVMALLTLTHGFIIDGEHAYSQRVAMIHGEGSPNWHYQGIGGKHDGQRVDRAAFDYHNHVHPLEVKYRHERAFITFSLYLSPLVVVPNERSAMFPMHLYVDVRGRSGANYAKLIPENAAEATDALCKALCRLAGVQFEQVGILSASEARVSKPATWFTDQAPDILTTSTLKNCRREPDPKVYYEKRGSRVYMDVHSVIREYPHMRGKLIEAMREG